MRRLRDRQLKLLYLCSIGEEAALTVVRAEEHREQPGYLLAMNATEIDAEEETYRSIRMSLNILMNSRNSCLGPRAASSSTTVPSPRTTLSVMVSIAAGVGWAESILTGRQQEPRSEDGGLCASQYKRYRR